MRFQRAFGRLYVPFELLFWSGGLLALAILDPFGTSLPELCLYKWVGFEWCPGCGLGRSVSFLLHGEPGLSLDAHVLGPFALSMIIYRITVLSKTTLTIHRKEHSHA